MDVRNCRSCGRLFNYLSGQQMCDSCKAALEEKFQDVKTYIREHQKSTINEVSEECDVSAKQIKQWIREERLSFTEDSGVYLECESCGEPVLTGRFCNKCKAKIQGDLQSAYVRNLEPKPAPSRNRDGDKMRFLDS